MPEQLTKHPEVTLDVLRSTGARCAEGAPQEILVKCPADRFCKLPGGEICVYGLPDSPHMTQLTTSDWRALAELNAAEAVAPGLGEAIIAGGLGLLIGALLGVVASRLRSRPS